jgi:hypothetical protein
MKKSVWSIVVVFWSSLIRCVVMNLISMIIIDAVKRRGEEYIEAFDRLRWLMVIVCVCTISLVLIHFHFSLAPTADLH